MLNLTWRREWKSHYRLHAAPFHHSIFSKLKHTPIVTPIRGWLPSFFHKGAPSFSGTKKPTRSSLLSITRIGVDIIGRTVLLFDATCTPIEHKPVNMVRILLERTREYSFTHSKRVCFLAKWSHGIVFAEAMKRRFR